MILVSCRGQTLLLGTRTNAFDIDPEATREYADGYDADIEAESFYGESDRREDVNEESAKVGKIVAVAVEQPYLIADIHACVFTEVFRINHSGKTGKIRTVIMAVDERAGTEAIGLKSEQMVLLVAAPVADHTGPVQV